MVGESVFIDREARAENIWLRSGVDAFRGNGVSSRNSVAGTGFVSLGQIQITATMKTELENITRLAARGNQRGKDYLLQI